MSVGSVMCTEGTRRRPLHTLLLTFPGVHPQGVVCGSLFPMAYTLLSFDGQGSGPKNPKVMILVACLGSCPSCGHAMPYSRSCCLHPYSCFMGMERSRHWQAMLPALIGTGA